MPDLFDELLWEFATLFFFRSEGKGIDLLPLMSLSELRFCITDNQGNRAASWKLWSPKKKSDLYLTCRELGSILKISFHESGSWHFGFSDGTLEKYFNSEEEFTKSRHFEIWSRPQPKQEGALMAFRIITPFSAITTPINSMPKDICWIPNCTIGYATEIFIIISSLKKDPKQWLMSNGKPANIVGHFKLNDVEDIIVTYQVIPLPKIQLNISNLQYFKGANKEDLRRENLRVIYYNARDRHGIRTIFDCAVELKKDNHPDT